MIPWQKESIAPLRLPPLTIYQTRHSKASIDRALQLRSLVEVKARLHVKQDATVARYEQHSRMSSDYSVLPMSVRRHVELLGARAEELVLDSS